MGELSLRDEAVRHTGIHAVESDDDEPLVGLRGNGSVGGSGEDQGGQDHDHWRQDSRRGAFRRISSES